MSVFALAGAGFSHSAAAAPSAGTPPAVLYLQVGGGAATVTPNITAPAGETLSYELDTTKTTNCPILSSVAPFDTARIQTPSINTTTGEVTVTPAATGGGGPTCVWVKATAGGASVSQALHIAVQDPSTTTNLRVTKLFWNATDTQTTFPQLCVKAGCPRAESEVRNTRVTPGQGYAQLDFVSSHTAWRLYLASTPLVTSTPSSPIQGAPTTGVGTNQTPGQIFSSTNANIICGTSCESQWSYATSATASGSGDALGAGRYYLALQPRGTHWLQMQSWVTYPATSALGSDTNPIVFPGTPSGLRLSGTTLNWNQTEHTHTGFEIFYATTAGLTGSSTSQVVNNGAAGLACSGGACTYDIANLPLTTGQTYHFKVAGLGSTDPSSGCTQSQITNLRCGLAMRSVLSGEVSGAVPSPASGGELALVNAALDGTTRTITIGATDVAIDLGGARGGSGARTYTLLQTGGDAADLAASLAALGLQAPQTSSDAITITPLDGGAAIAGNITLTYAVADSSGSASYRISISVSSARALNIVGTRTPLTVEPVNFPDPSVISYTLREGISGGATGTTTLRGLRITKTSSGATISGTPTQSVTFRVVATVSGEVPVESMPITLTVSTPPAPAAGGGGSGGAIALVAIAAGAYFWWKKRQIANGADPAKVALLPDVDFDLDRNDNRAFFTKINWKNATSSRWQIRTNLRMHTKYSGKLLDWNANSHFGYRLNGKFGDFNPYAKAKFVQNAPENAKMIETYTLGLNYAIPNRFSVQFLQPDDEVWRYSLKTQVQLRRGLNLNFARANSDLPDFSLGLRYQNPQGFGVSVTQPNSEIHDYSLGIQWRSASRIRYEMSGNTSGRALKLRGSISF